MEEIDGDSEFFLIFAQLTLKYYRLYCLKGGQE